MLTELNLQEKKNITYKLNYIEQRNCNWYNMAVLSIEENFMYNLFPNERGKYMRCESLTSPLGSDL